jgi:hypothetical protein
MVAVEVDLVVLTLPVPPVEVALVEVGRLLV